MASCPNLNEEDETEQNGYLVGSSEVGSKQVVRQRHDHKGRDKLPQIEGCGEQGHDGGGGVAASLDAGDGKLHQQAVSLAEMSLDDAQRRGDGGSGHHGEQRHRQDGSRHLLRDVNLFHKNLWSFQLYQAIESLQFAGAKVRKNHLKKPFLHLKKSKK